MPHCRQHEPGPAFEHRARPIDMVLESSDMTCTKARLGEPAESGHAWPLQEQRTLPDLGITILLNT